MDYMVTTREKDKWESLEINNGNKQYFTMYNTFAQVKGTGQSECLLQVSKFLKNNFELKKKGSSKNGKIL